MSTDNDTARPDTPNPYSAPVSAQVPDRTPGSPVKAVLLGFLVDFGGSFVSGVVLSVGYAAILASSGIPREQILSSLTNPDGMTPYKATSYAVGLTFSVLGGYCCARIAKRRELLLAGSSATLTAVVALAASSGKRPLLEQAVMIALSYGSVFAGAHLGRRKNNSLGRAPR